MKLLKGSFIILIPLAVFTNKCSFFEKTSDAKNAKVVETEYRQWSEPPLAKSEVPEKGFDLFVTVKNWPEKAKPDHIIFRKKKSFPAEVAQSTDAGVIIKGRIIQSSSVLSETSETVNKSDRLVFTNPKGNVEFVEIGEWKRSGQSNGESESNR